MNEMASLSLMDEIQTAYQISDKDLFEKHTAQALGYAQKYPMEFEKLQKMKWRHR